MDEEITDRKIKLRRALILLELGVECVDSGCELSGYHFGLGEDNGGGIHLDLYAYDHEGDLMMLTIDHIKPKSKGGKNHIKNYQTMCMLHNHEKSDSYEEE